MRNASHPSELSATSQIPALPARLAAPDLRLMAQFTASVPKAFADRVRHAITRATRCADAKATYRALRGLDTRTLRDLGIHHSEMHALALETYGEIEAKRRPRA